jgi:hypothetical protein
MDAHKGKGEVEAVDAMEVCGVVEEDFILNLGAGWGASSDSCPGRCIPEKPFLVATE